MKTAILYSGALRNLASTIENNLSIFKDADLYFSVWDHFGYADHINSPDYIKANRILNGVVTEHTIKNLIKDLDKVKAVKIESYKTCELNLINGCNSNLAAQYYKIFDCFSLVKPEYDLYVRLRCDVLLTHKPKMPKDSIIFPNKIWYNHIKTDEFKDINEMIWLTDNYDYMKKCCSIINNAEKINSIITSRNQKSVNYGENICYMNLEAEGLLDKVELFDFDYRVLR